jgi:putative oxidoreductase
MDPALRGSLAVLLLRLITGVAFLFHGWSKIQNPFHWMDQAANAPPAFLQALAAVAEFGGGIGLLLGLLTPLCAAGIFCTMAYAAGTHILRGDPFVGKGGSYELALLYLTISVAFLLLGPGRFSLDNAITQRANGGSTTRNSRESLHARVR